jgi:hypothetical protein
MGIISSGIRGSGKNFEFILTFIQGLNPFSNQSSSSCNGNRLNLSKILFLSKQNDIQKVVLPAALQIS